LIDEGQKAAQLVGSSGTGIEVQKEFKNKNRFKNL
jgi:hypothetical protein